MCNFCALFCFRHFLIMKGSVACSFRTRVLLNPFDVNLPFIYYLLNIGNSNVPMLKVNV